MASTVSPVASLDYRTAIAVYELPETGDSEEEEEEEFTIIPIDLRLPRPVSEGYSGSNYRRSEICLDEVVMATTENPVRESAWDLRDALTELGVAAGSHAAIVARLLEFIEARVYLGPTFSVMVEMTIEEVAGPPVMPMANDDQLGDFAFVDQVQRLREIIRGMSTDDFDMAVSESMEIGTRARTMPATEAAIARLEKVRQGEVEEEDLCCVICYDDGAEEFARMPCSHLFHCKCLGAWLRASAACPLCRFQLTTT